ncbi:MAG: hypothetical protein RIS42_188 [Bacteroidota bacterium]|jgi:hypothetical protein
MRNNPIKGFCILLAAWLLVANVGFAWSQSTCLFTGIQKTSWQDKATCCGKKSIQNPFQKTTISRASCCQYQHFQVKQQASYVLEKQAFVSYLWVKHADVSLSFSFHSFTVDIPLYTPDKKIFLPSVRRAYLQVYQI